MDHEKWSKNIETMASAGLIFINDTTQHGFDSYFPSYDCQDYYEWIIQVYKQWKSNESVQTSQL